MNRIIPSFHLVITSFPNCAAHLEASCGPPTDKSHLTGLGMCQTIAQCLLAATNDYWVHKQTEQMAREVRPGFSKE